jgi:hypothetical protein
MKYSKTNINIYNFIFIINFFYNIYNNFKFYIKMTENKKENSV